VTAPADQGRVALVTGAGNGLGEVIAATLHGAGYRVAAADIDLEAAQRVAARLDATAATAVCLMGSNIVGSGETRAQAAPRRARLVMLRDSSWSFCVVSPIRLSKTEQSTAGSRGFLLIPQLILVSGLASNADPCDAAALKEVQRSSAKSPPGPGHRVQNRRGRSRRIAVAEQPQPEREVMASGAPARQATKYLQNRNYRVRVGFLSTNTFWLCTVSNLQG